MSELPPELAALDAECQRLEACDALPLPKQLQAAPAKWDQAFGFGCGRNDAEAFDAGWSILKRDPRFALPLAGYTDEMSRGRRLITVYTQEEG
jgi:hypothetical protein